MKFIRDNILKILLVLGILIILIVVLIACSSSGGNVSSKSYSRIEDSLQVDATNYLQKHANLLPKEEGKIVKVQMDTVYSKKQMKKIVSPEDNTVNCDGYVNVSFRLNEEDEKVYRVVPHIKCGDKYETEDLYVHILKNENIVTEFDGLYEIGNEYVFRGHEPNNYLLINENLYRILSIDKDGYIKLIGEKRLPVSSVWDNRYNVSTQESSGINDYYLSRIRENSVDFYKRGHYYSETEKNLFVKHEYCIGSRSINNKAIDTTEECQKKADDDYVSQPLLYDYLIVSTDPNCKTIEDYSCTNYNYLNSLRPFFTMNGVKEDEKEVFIISKVGSTNYLNNSYSLALITYIANVSYSSGKGTYDSPYIVK